MVYFLLGKPNLIYLNNCFNNIIIVHSSPVSNVSNAVDALTYCCTCTNVD